MHFLLNLLKKCCCVALCNSAGKCPFQKLGFQQGARKMDLFHDHLCSSKCFLTHTKRNLSTSQNCDLWRNAQLNDQVLFYKKKNHLCTLICKSVFRDYSWVLWCILEVAQEASYFYSLPSPPKFSLRIRVAGAAKDWKCLVTSSRASHQSILLFCDDEDNIHACDVLVCGCVCQ